VVSQQVLRIAFEVEEVSLGTGQNSEILMFRSELVAHPHIVHDLWNEKQRIKQNEGRSIKVAKEQPDIHKNGTIKNAVSIQICHSLYNAFELSYQLHTYQYLHTSTDQ
jgi:GrpB-like predicted nucleotidyltransferase (UPF0157 family)